jgi:hypothetical protein
MRRRDVTLKKELAIMYKLRYDYEEIEAGGA